MALKWSNSVIISNCGSYIIVNIDNKWVTKRRTTKHGDYVKFGTPHIKQLEAIDACEFDSLGG